MALQPLVTDDAGLTEIRAADKSLRPRGETTSGSWIGYFDRDVSVGAGSGSSSTATITVLGPVGLSLAGTAVALAPSERTLLAGIAVHLGRRPLSADALAAWIWSDSQQPPPNRVQTLVSGLRRKDGWSLGSRN